MVYDSNNTLSTHAQSLSLASAIHVNPLVDPQATLTTVQLTQREMWWLQVLHSHPAFTATNSRKDMQQ
jgi:proteasome lid subunit RPN8/RPN11